MLILNLKLLQSDWSKNFEVFFSKISKKIWLTCISLKMHYLRDLGSLNHPYITVFFRNSIQFQHSIFNLKYPPWISGQQQNFWVQVIIFCYFLNFIKLTESNSFDNGNLFVANFRSKHRVNWRALVIAFMKVVT